MVVAITLNRKSTRTQRTHEQKLTGKNVYTQTLVVMHAKNKSVLNFLPISRFLSPTTQNPMNTRNKSTESENKLIFKQAPGRWCSAAVMAVALIALALSAPLASAQTPSLSFQFNDNVPSVATTDLVDSAVAYMTNHNLVRADLHGTNGSGPGGLGKSLDLTTDDGANTSLSVSGSASTAVAEDWDDPTISNIGMVSTFTLTFWFKNGAVFGSGDSPLLFEFGPGSDPVGDFATQTAGSIGFAENTSGNPEFWENTTLAPNPVASGNLSANVWYYYALTYDGSNYRVYVGTETGPATLVNTVASSGATLNFGTAGTIILGNRGNGNNRNFPGWLAHWQFYNGFTASQSQVESIRQSAIPDPYAKATSILPATAPIGAVVNITSQISAQSAATDQWYFVSGGVTNAIAGATNATYVIQSAQAANAGSYFMVVGDNNGSVTNALATLSVIPLAGAGVGIYDFPSLPTPGTYDQSQLQTNSEATGGTAQDGLNYFSNNNPPPGQTFTTGPNAAGYIINGIYFKTSGLNSGSGATGSQAWTVRLYSVSGSTATLLSTYVTGNTVAFSDGDWLLYSGGFTNVLQPNTTYAYTTHQPTGYDLLGYNNSGTDLYPSGDICLIPTAGGAITFGTSGVDDAAFDIGLSPTPSSPIITQEPVSQTVVVGEPVSFSVNILGGSSPTFQWYTSSDTNYDNPQPISGATSATYSIASPTLGNGTNYFVIVNPGNVYSTVATLTVRSSVNNLAWLGASSFNWDLSTANWSNTVTQVGGFVYQTGDNVQFTDAGKSTSPIDLTTTLSPTSVGVISASNYVFNGTGSLVGNVQLAKGGTGMLTVSNANSFNGSATVTNGILQIANAAALGNATNTITVNGGTIDFNGVQSPNPLQFNVEGTGSTNQGALYNSSGTALQNGAGIHGFTMLGDTTIGANGRWDVYGTSGSTGLNGNGHNLTKVGSGSVWTQDTGTNNQLENISILGGLLGFQGTNGLGDPNALLYVASGATLGFFANPAGEVISKNIVMSNASFSTSQGNLTMDAPFTLYGTNTIVAGYEESNYFLVTFNGPMSGTGGWSIGSIQQYYFEGTNTYSGPTILNAYGTLFVGANSSLGTSSLINLVNPDATLDVSAMPNGLTVGNGQTLEGFANNFVLVDVGGINGNVIMTTGSTLSPNESAPGELSISGNLALTNVAVNIELGSDPTQIGDGVSSFIAVGNSLSLGGVNTLVITPTGPLSTAQPYTILNYNGALSGGSGNITVSNSNPRYTVTLVNPTTTSGALELSVSGVPQPLVWKGGNPPQPNVWNHTYTNFFNTYTNAFDHFYDGDLVTFDDTSITNNVNVTETVTPGLLTFNNNVTNYTFYGVGNIAGTIDKEGSGSVTLAMSNAPVVSYITNNLGTLVVVSPTTTNNTVLAATLVDNGSGLGTFVKAGTSLMQLTGNNANYNGVISVTNGTLQYASLTSLGNGAVVYATNGGSLDINNTDTGTKIIAVSGMGYNGQGAMLDLTTTYPAYPYQIAHDITLLGDAALGANARWDITGGTFTGNGHNLYKVGPSQITLINNGPIGVANIYIDAGNLTFQGTNDMGNPNMSLTVESNAILGFWAGPNPFVKTNMTLINAGITCGGSANTFQGTLTLDPGTNTIAVSADLYINGPVVGAGGFSLSGGNNLWLEGTNTYSGPTVIGGDSTVQVTANSPLGSSSPVEIDGGSTLNVSTPASFTFGTGQTLVGNGTLEGGNVYFGNGSTLAVGFSGSTYTLTEDGSLTFQAGSTNDVVINPGATTNVPADNVTGLGTVTMGGTLAINNIGNALATGDAIKLFSATNYTGSFANIIPATPGPGLAWNTNSLDSSGTLYVTTGVVISSPKITSIKLSGTTLTILGTNGTLNGSFVLLGSTNVALPLSSWTPILTNSFNSSGDLNLSTNIVNPAVPGEYYIIWQQ
jgi:autotransporter-associated beta strand protein